MLLSPYVKCNCRLFVLCAKHHHQQQQQQPHHQPPPQPGHERPTIHLVATKPPRVPQPAPAPPPAAVKQPQPPSQPPQQPQQPPPAAKSPRPHQGAHAWTTKPAHPQKVHQPQWVTKKGASAALPKRQTSAVTPNQKNPSWRGESNWKWQKPVKSSYLSFFPRSFDV